MTKTTECYANKFELALGASKLNRRRTNHAAWLDARHRLPVRWKLEIKLGGL